MNITTLIYEAISKHNYKNIDHTPYLKSIYTQYKKSLSKQMSFNEFKKHMTFHKFESPDQMIYFDDGILHKHVFTVEFDPKTKKIMYVSMDG